MYIENIRKKFGSFVFAQPRTGFVPALLDRYIRIAIPGFVNFRNGNTAATASNLSHQNDSIDERPVDNIPESDDEMCFEPKLEDHTYISKLKVGQILTVDLTEDNETDEDSVGQTPSMPTLEDSDDDEPRAKQSRLTNDNSDGSDIKSDASDITITTSAVDKQDNMDFYNEMPTSNSINFENVSTWRQNINNSMQTFADSVDGICQINTNLEMALKESEARHHLALEGLEGINATLLVEVGKLTNELNSQNETLKKEHDLELTQLKEKHAQQLLEQKEKWEKQSEKFLKDQLRVSNEAHDMELARNRKRYTDKIIKLQGQSQIKAKEHCLLMAKKDDERQKALDDCKMEYTQRIENAKNHKYCKGCDMEGPIDFYVCGIGCQQRCW